MSNVELPLPPHRLTREIQPRHPHREIAELLAAGILRARQNSTWAGDLSPIRACGHYASQMKVAAREINASKRISSLS
jgi:hypothetical protein